MNRLAVAYFFQQHSGEIKETRLNYLSSNESAFLDASQRKQEWSLTKDEKKQIISRLALATSASEVKQTRKIVASAVLDSTPAGKIQSFVGMAHIQRIVLAYLPDHSHVEIAVDFAPGERRNLDEIPIFLVEHPSEDSVRGENVLLESCSPMGQSKLAKGSL